MTRFNQTKCKKMLAIGFAAALLGSMGGYNSVLEAAVPDKVISEIPAAAAEQNAKTQRAEAKPDAKQAAEEENTDAAAVKAPAASVQENMHQAGKAEQPAAKPGDSGAKNAVSAVACESLPEVKKQLGFAPLGFNEKSGYACVERYILDQKVADIRYADTAQKDVKFSVRTALQKSVGTDNISGCNPALLKESKAGKTVLHSGKIGEKYYSAYWTAGAYDFSVSAINLEEAAFHKAVQDLVRTSEKQDKK